MPKISSFAVSLNVPEPEASAAFLSAHFGYITQMQNDGFVSLSHPNGGSNIIFLRAGLPTFKPAEIAGRAREGVLLVLVVDAIDEFHEQLVAQDIAVVTSPETEPWGERFAQYRDPNGLIVQLVQWV